MNNEIHWSCRSHDRRRPGIGEVKLSLGQLNQITGKGFTGSVTGGCDCMNCRGKLHTRGGGRIFVKCVIFESFSD